MCEEGRSWKGFEDKGGVTGRSWGCDSTLMPSSHLDEQIFKEASVP